MPLSFATILGGLVTLIGTPPNIIIAQYRETVSGAPFQMFDFAPVGLVCAGVGILFVALFGWRLVPGADESVEGSESGMDLEDRFRGVYALEFFGEKTTNEKAIGDLQLTEVLVTPETRIVGRAAIDIRLRARRGVALLGISS